VAQCRLKALQELPDLSGLTSLESLKIWDCDEIKALPTGIEQLVVLKEITLRNLAELEELPDTLGRLTSLERLTLAGCSQLHALPASIMHLSRLQHLSIVRCPLQDMPCIEALTALRTLDLGVADYAQGSRAFKALSRSLPRLQQLNTLHLGGDGRVGLRAEDVLAVGRALRAWPLPLLRDLQDDDDAQRGMRLGTCWQELGLPAAGADWTNATTLHFFLLQQQKVAAFASGMHARLGAASAVSQLDEHALAMIADAVLGGWGLRKEWQTHELGGEGGP